MASLVDVKKYLEREPNGRPVPMSEIKELSAEDRAELIREYEKLGEAVK